MTIIDMDNNSLIREVLNKNHKCENFFFDKYRKFIKSYIISKYSKLNDIDDCVSEILIRIYENLHNYDSNYDFDSWVKAISKHYLIDKWRANTVTFTSLNEATYNTHISNTSTEFFNAEINDSYCIGTNGFCNVISESTEPLYASNVMSYTLHNSDFESCNSVNYIISELSSADYTMLDMKYVQGYNYCEIGQEFNLTSSTVSNKVNYIKTKLKKNYTELYNK